METIKIEHASSDIRHCLIMHGKRQRELRRSTKNEKMSTEDSVMITTLEKDTLYGIGFESDSDLENWKILKPSGVTERN